MSNYPYSTFFLPLNPCHLTLHYGYYHNGPSAFGQVPQQQFTLLKDNLEQRTAFPQMHQEPSSHSKQEPPSGVWLINTDKNSKRLFESNTLEHLQQHNKSGLQSKLSKKVAIPQKQRPKKRYTQNPRRNVITNLGNQLLSFLGNKCRLKELLRNFSQKLEQESMSSVAIYIHQVKKAQNSYLNVHKMREIWYPSDVNSHLEEIVELFRKVSYYYLNCYVHLQVIRSGRMVEQTKKHHLRGIRSLIEVLRNPPTMADGEDINQ